MASFAVTIRKGGPAVLERRINRTDIHDLFIPSSSQPSIESPYNALQANDEYFDANEGLWRRRIRTQSCTASLFDKQTHFIALMVANAFDTDVAKRQHIAAKNTRLYQRKQIDQTATLLLGVVAESGWDQDAAKARYGRLRGTRMRGDVWTSWLPPRYRTTKAPVIPDSETLICGVLAAIAIGKVDDARRTFEQWRDDGRLLHNRTGLWKEMHSTLPKVECIFSSNTQLLGILAEHRFDPIAAKVRYQALKETALFVSPNVWHEYLSYAAGTFGGSDCFSVSATLLDLLVQSQLGLASIDAQEIPPMPIVLDLS